MKERSGATVPQLLLLHLLLLPAAVAVTSTSQVVLPGCQEKCGNVSIPYPFGIGEKCYKDAGYEITCNGTKPILCTVNVEILSISLHAQVLINGQYVSDCYDSRGVRLANPIDDFGWTDLRGSPFRYSFTRNKFTAIGCDTLALFSNFVDTDFFLVCMSICVDNRRVREGSCTVPGCCQTKILPGLQRFNTSLRSLFNHTRSLFNPCSYAFLADEEMFTFKVSDLSTNGSLDRTMIPVALDWSIGNETCVQAQTMASYACGKPNSYCANSANGPGYRCYCNVGYEGNPYLHKGCQEIK